MSSLKCTQTVHNNISGKWTLCKIVYSEKTIVIKDNKTEETLLEDEVNYNICPIISFFHHDSSYISTDIVSNFSWESDGNNLTIFGSTNDILRNGKYEVLIITQKELRIISKENNSVYYLNKLK